MAGNVRNARTTHPRKTARRERAAARFSIKHQRMGDEKYMTAKSIEAKALGLSL